MRSPAVLATLLVACGPAAEPAAPVTPTAPAAAAAATPIADAYRDVAARILEAARSDAARDETYARLAYLTDRIGPRLAGSKALDDAIAWAAAVMRGDGHEVRLEKVMVPHWVRGAESARIVAPVAHELPILGLGGTIATPEGGVTAPVVVVTSWDDLAAKQAQVKGAIVLYDVAMPAWTEEHGHGYGEVVGYRWAGPAAAAEHGAVAALVRSVTANSLRTPHTGSMGPSPIPAAAVTTEDAAYLRRLVEAGERVEVDLRLSGEHKGDVESANVIGELRGRERPDEIVVISCHIDSWDVGQGAHDDGGGCVAVMQALTTLRRLELTPRRTVRVVLYTNEENGLRGARAYAADHAAELDQHVGALEMDLGAYAPVGFQVDRGAYDEQGRALPGTDPRLERILAAMRDVATLLEPIGATRVQVGHAGSDIEPLAKAGVPAVGMATDSRRYFDLHHTAADTLDKVDPQDLADNVAAIAVWAYVVADLPARLDAAP